MKSGKALSIILGIITSILVALTIIGVVKTQDPPLPEANVITQEFMEDYTRWTMWNNLSSVTIIWALIFAFFTVISVVWGTSDYDDDGERFILRCVLYILVIVVGIILQPVSLFDLQEMALSTPHAQTVSISYKYSQRRNRGKEYRLEYCFVYSNGSEERVTESCYNEHNEGEKVYLVMCGNTMIGRFDADLFRLNDQEQMYGNKQEIT